MGTGLKRYRWKDAFLNYHDHIRADSKELSRKLQIENSSMLCVSITILQLTRLSAAIFLYLREPRDLHYRDY